MAFDKKKTFAVDISNTPPPPQRTYWYSESVDNHMSSGDDWTVNSQKMVATEEEANLISSLTDAGTHRPVIDLDIPCKLVPSAQEGHFHLYIDKDINKAQMDALVEGLAKAGIIEQGVSWGYQERGMTMVRTPAAIEKKKKMLEAAEVARLEKQLEFKKNPPLSSQGVHAVFGDMFDLSVKVQHPVKNGMGTLEGVIISLNDQHGWKREWIASWLEDISDTIDITIKDQDGNPVMKW